MAKLGRAYKKLIREKAYDRFLARIFIISFSAERIIAYSIALIICSYAMGYMIPKIDESSPTTEEYTILEEQLKSIQNDPEKLIKLKSLVVINEDEILVSVESKKCKVTGKYNTDLKLIDLTREALNMSVLKLILLIFAFFILLFGFSWFVFMGVIFILEGAFLFIRFNILGIYRINSKESL